MKTEGRQENNIARKKKITPWKQMYVFQNRANKIHKY